MISSNESFKNVPILYFTPLFFCINPLCIPITLLVNKFNIGPPDEPDEVLHLCLMSYLYLGSKIIPFPYETAAFWALG